MCDSCGCGDVGSGVVEMPVRTNLLAANDQRAGYLRARFEGLGLLVVNIMASPGAGKTALLEETARRFGAQMRMTAIVGDQQTENDAARLRAAGLVAEQVITGTACHLDAEMVAEALDRVELDGLDILFIENVGNLVCPASFDLGEHRRIALLSTPEGDDKPAKYPSLFHRADLVLLTKRDLAPAIPEFDAAAAEGRVRGLGNAAPVLELSARSGLGFEAWHAWLLDALHEVRSQGARPGTGGHG